MKLFDQMNHYQVLEIDPAASTEEIQAAFKRMREIWGPDSLASYSLYAPEERKDILHRIEEAYYLLMDERSRKDYDKDILKEGFRQKWFEVFRREGAQQLLPFPESAFEEPDTELKTAELAPDAPPKDAAPPPPNPQSPAAAAVAGATAEAQVKAHPKEERTSEVFAAPPPEPPSEVTGPALRAYRKALGISLDEIFDKTRIRKPILVAIETEDKPNLPAKVFLKGFLVAYLKHLNFPNAQNVALQYLQRCVVK